MSRKERSVVAMFVHWLDSLGQYLWLCFEASFHFLLVDTKKIGKWLGLFVVALIGATVFNGVVQPVLVDFHPIFSDHPPGFDPDHEPPAVLFLYLTVFIKMYVFSSLKDRVKEAYDSGVRAGAKQFSADILFILYLPLFPILMLLSKN